MKKKILIGIIVLAIIAVILISGCLEIKLEDGEVSIAELEANLDKYAGSEITVVGEVSMLGILKCPCFELTDSSYNIPISTLNATFIYNGSEITVNDLNNGDKVRVSGVYPFGATNHKEIKIISKINDCSKITDQTIKDFCYKEYAVKTSNVSACKKIVESTTASNCYSDLKHLLNLQVCEAEENEHVRNSCYSSLVNARHFDVSICNKITNITSYAVRMREACYQDVAIKTGNLQLCELISTKDTCYETAARELNNSLLCEKINESSKDSGVSIKGRCYSTMATLKRNSSLCKFSTGLEDTCYWNVALSIKNLSICANINNSVTRDMCKRGEHWGV